MFALTTNHVVDQKIGNLLAVPFRVRIVGNATPASKTLFTDLPSATIRALGITAASDAIESNASVGFTTPVDATNSRFGILIQTADLLPLVGDYVVAGIDVVKSQDLVGATSTTSMTFALVNTGTTIQGVTSGGNIALEVNTASSGVDLSTTNTIDFRLVVRFIRQR